MSALAGMWVCQQHGLCVLWCLLRVLQAHCIISSWLVYDSCSDPAACMMACQHILHFW